MSGLSSGMMSCSRRRLVAEKSLLSLNQAGSSTSSSSSKYFSTSAARPRNTPVRRPRDPLDSSPDAIRHKLPTGETFIIRPPPTAPTPYNLGPSQTTVVYPSTSASFTLPPPLRPSTRSTRHIQEKATPEQLAEIQKLRTEDPIKNTISRLAKKFEISPMIVKKVAPLSAAVRRFKEAEVETRRANWGANKTLQRELRKERKALW